MPYSHRFPPPQGLYDPRHEKDACGVAFVATLTGEASHDIVVKARTALRNLDHRGAAGAEPNSGDGAGILLQVPDTFLREEAAAAGFTLPAAGSYAVGTAFLPRTDDEVALVAEALRERMWEDLAPSQLAAVLSGHVEVAPAGDATWRLSADLRNDAIYASILRAIAHGHHRPSRIALAVGEARWTLDGRGNVMPAWAGRLDESTIKALTVYVHTLGGGEK